MILEVQLEAEPLIKEHYQKSYSEIYNALLAKGMEQVEWSDADNRYFLKVAARDAPWEDVIQKLPDVGPKLKDMLTK